MIELESEIRKVVRGTLSEQEVATVVALAHEQLALAVGTRLSALLDDEQLTVFSAIHESGDDEAGRRFLDKHVPGYPVVVREELDAILDRLAGLAASLIHQENTGV